MGREDPPDDPCRSPVAAPRCRCRGRLGLHTGPRARRPARRGGAAAGRRRPVSPALSLLRRRLLPRGLPPRLRTPLALVLVGVPDMGPHVHALLGAVWPSGAGLARWRWWGSGGWAGDPDPLVGQRDAVATEHVAPVGMDHDLSRDEHPLG